MNTSMKTLTVVVVVRIQPASYEIPLSRARARIKESVIAPLATAAPSVLTASPIHAAATSGSLQRNWRAARGRIRSSTTENKTTSEETMIGTTGPGPDRRARRDGRRDAADRDPRSQGAAHSRLNPKTVRASR